MAAVKFFIKCIFGPRLFRVHSSGSIEGKLYEPYSLERWGNSIIKSVVFVGYASPLFLVMFYRRGIFSTTAVTMFAQLYTMLGIVYVGSCMLRAVGRIQNPDYLKFLVAVSDAHVVMNKESKTALSRYDFEFSHWPVEFDTAQVEEKKGVPHRSLARVGTRNLGTSEWVKTLPCQLVSVVVAHTAGIRLVYPGSIGMLQAAMDGYLVEGRAKLIEECRAERFKIATCDRNHIDLVFVDQRARSRNGSTLVICCEGNAGFYEAGIVMTPVESGYSVIGWNHPGFGGSTGMPYPEQEGEAVDAVVQFALHHLEFQPKDIILYGWSIGGFTSTMAAAGYPEMKGIILDASFDHVLPLALARMPSSLGPIIRFTILNHINLCNAAQLMRFPGPVLIIRRTQDEVIVTEDQNMRTNRGNFLLMKLLRHRFPGVFNDVAERGVWAWLDEDHSHPGSSGLGADVDQDLCRGTLASYLAQGQTSYPLQMGNDWEQDMKNQMAIYLASKHLVDFASSHCTPLPTSHFQMPWDLLGHNGSKSNL